MGTCCMKKCSFQWAQALSPPKASIPHRSLRSMGWAAGLQPGTPDQSTAAIAVLHAHLRTEVTVRCNFCVPYSQAPHCSRPSLPVTQLLLLSRYFWPATINKRWCGVLKMPWRFRFWTNSTGLICSCRIYEKCYFFFCCKQLEQVQLNLNKDWVCFWAGDSCSCLFLIKYYPCKWHTHFFLFNCHGWGDLIYAPIQ